MFAEEQYCTSELDVPLAACRTANCKSDSETTGETIGYMKEDENKHNYKST